MSLIPRWQNKFPTHGGTRASEFFNLGQLFENLEKELEVLGPAQSGLSISSDDKSVFIEANVPGLTAKEVEVTIDSNNCLWIKGEKNTEEKDKQKKYYKRAQLSFSYCVPLWEEIDASKEPEAICKDGVMRVIFAKTKEKQIESKRINVKE